MTTDTRDIAVRAFGSLIATRAGRAAVASLGLSGADAPVFRCALYDTLVEEVAGDEPATVLVIDVQRKRFAALTLPGGPASDVQEAQRASKLGHLIDGLQAGIEGPAGDVLAGIRGRVVELAA